MLYHRLGALFKNIPAEKLNHLRNQYGVQYDAEPDRNDDNYMMPIDGGYVSITLPGETLTPREFFKRLAYGISRLGIQQLLEKHDMHVVVKG